MTEYVKYTDVIDIIKDAKCDITDNMFFTSRGAYESAKETADRIEREVEALPRKELRK